MKSVIYEFVDGRGQGIVSSWLPLQDASLRARIDQKLDALEDHGNDLPPRLLDGTPHKHVDKMRVYGKKTTWRIMVSKERVDKQFTFTLLFVAQEKDRKLIPKDAYDRAETNRLEIQQSPNRRQIYERDDN